MGPGKGQAAAGFVAAAGSVASRSQSCIAGTPVTAVCLEPGLPRWLSDNPPAGAGDARDGGSIPGRQHTLEEEMALSPGESHRQRSLPGYSPWSHERVGHDLETKQ